MPAMYMYTHNIALDLIPGIIIIPTVHLYTNMHTCMLVYNIVIATSGIDYNVKLWEPVAAHEASLDNLKEVHFIMYVMHVYNIIIMPLTVKMRAIFLVTVMQ